MRMCVCMSRIELREVAPLSSLAEGPYQEVSRLDRVASGPGVKFRLLLVYKVIFAREKVSGMRI